MAEKDHWLKYYVHKSFFLLTFNMLCGTNIMCGKTEVRAIDRFDALYKEYRDDVYGFLSALTMHDRMLAEDMTQEAFLQAYFSIEKFKGNCSIKTWLFAIAKNVLFKHLRKNKKHILLNDGTQKQSALKERAFEDILSEKELFEKALLIISGFSQNTSEVMMLRLGGIPYSQIADRLGIGDGSARVLYSRGKNELIRMLTEVYGYEISM